MCADSPQEHQLLEDKGRMDSSMNEKLRRLIEGALIDNGGMDFDLMTRTEESEVAEFIMSYIWPEIKNLQAWEDPKPFPPVVEICTENLRRPTLNTWSRVDSAWIR